LRPPADLLSIGQKITSRFVFFRSAKAATFAERKATIIVQPIPSIAKPPGGVNSIELASIELA
jgi:hypothetical protein